MTTNTDQNEAAQASCAPATGYVVAATLTRSTQDGWATKVETKLLLWMGEAQSEDEAVGTAVRKMLKESKGYSLQMHVVSRSPHTELALAASPATNSNEVEDSQNGN